MALFCLNAQAKSNSLSPEKLAHYQPIPVKDGMTLSVAIECDEILRIPLKENPTTGYLWEVSCENDTGALKIVSETFYPPQSQLPPPPEKKKGKHHEKEDEPPRLAGAPGLKLITFKAEHRGTVTLHFRHARSWEHDAEKEFTMIVFITED